MRRGVVGLGLVLTACLLLAGCQARVGRAAVGDEIARCEVAAGACSDTIAVAVEAFAERHPDQPAVVRAVAFTRHYEILPVGGPNSVVVELHLAGGSTRVYGVSCGGSRIPAPGDPRCSVGVP